MKILIAAWSVAFAVLLALVTLASLAAYGARLDQPEI